MSADLVPTEKLKQRQLKIQEKRKTTSRRDFLMQITSWYPLVLHRIKNHISIYPDTKRSCPIISHEQFLAWDPIIHDDLNKWNFFDDFSTLFTSLPFSSLYNYVWAENSWFAFSVLWSTNCYLSFTVITDCENILYSFAIKEWCKDVLNSLQVSNSSQNIYSSKCVIRSHNVFFSQFVENSSNIWFSSNLIWCSDCIFCDWLMNMSYCINNQQLSIEEYSKRKKEILYKKDAFYTSYKVSNTTWTNYWSSDFENCNFVLNSKNVVNGNYSFNLINAKNTFVVWSPNMNTDIYDAFEAWSLGNNDLYWVLNTWVRSDHVYNCEWIVTCHKVFYSRFLENCSFCLWCIWLKNKSYCIFNKQYTKEDRYDEVDKIFSQMEKDWQLWEFFPWSMNPFYFNDTAAYLIDPSFTKEEVTAKGYLRREEPIKVDIPDWMETVQVDELWQFEWFDSEWVWTINPDILKKIIIDTDGNIYRIIKMEYDFLVKHGLPLPRKHRLERMKDNFKIA